MRRIPARTWLLICISALLQVASFPVAGPLPVWRSPLGWIALVPLLVALLNPTRAGMLLSVRESALLGYLCGILWYMGNCYWIFQTMHLYGGMPPPLALFILILFALYLGLYHALFAGVIATVYKSLGLRATLAFVPFAWVAVELARARITGFPWDLLGYSQVDNVLITPLARVAGVMAISFLLASINAVVAWCFFRKDVRRVAVPAVILLFGIAMQWFSNRSTNFRDANSYRPVAVMMQENLEVGAVGREVAPISLAQELAQFTSQSLAAKHSMPDGMWAGLEIKQPTVIIWPEAPSHLISTDPYFRASLGQLARTAKAPVIAGSLGVEFDPNGREYSEFDSATLFDAAGNYSGRYDKIHLVPWGEYVPYPAIFGFAHKLTEGLGNMTPGHTRTVFTTGGHTYGAFVCYESIFGDEVRHFAANGAEVLVQISDDGWYGDSGAPWQHLNMARMRAIENRRWLLRSTNTGVTTAIDPYGRLEAQAPRHVREAFAFPFEFANAADTTFYTRHGDWCAWLCALVTFAALLYVPIRKRFIQTNP